jgi:RNA ligase (TIGR02306 family)
VRVFAEIFGSGVQDLSYGRKAPEVQAFDVRIGDRFLTPDERDLVLSCALLIDRVPVLYRGPYSLEALEPHRDGKDTLSGSHVREGIVIRACAPGRHPLHGRKIGKWVSPDYLLRKGGTELS